MDIILNVIPHHEQRYPTCGDWQLNYEQKTVIIRASELNNWRYEFLVQFHELIEAMLCFSRGITTEVVDKFDMEYENRRDIGDESEPGDDSNAPYRREHFFATSLERLMAAELGVDWDKYEEEIYKLD